MGLVINPTAFRIGYVKAWTDAWYLHRMHYPVFVHKSLEIKALLQYILLRYYPAQWSHWIYSHATYYYLGNKFQISLFVYDGNDPYQYMRLARNHRFGWFRKSKFYKFWTKKQLLDLQFFYQRWFLLCQAMNFDFEALTLDSLKWRVNKRHLRKIDGLRKKYGRFWVAREELFIWKFPINMTSEDSFNKMGMTLLNLLYKMYIMPKIKSSFDSRDLGYVDSGYNVLQSHKIFYFFFSYINKILKYIPTYPVGLFNRLTYKACYRIFRMYFVYKPYWTNLSKLYELILLFINVNSKIKVYILDNSHLNAAYLARYIITCLRAKFDYRDTMIPIRKTLLKIMLAKRWRPVSDIKKKGWQVYLERYKSLMKDRIFFHLINSDLIKMFFYRLRLLQEVRDVIKKPRSMKVLNFHALKKSILCIRESFFKNESLLLKNTNVRSCFELYTFKTKHLKLSVLLKRRLHIKYYYFKKRVIKKKFRIIFRKFRRRKNNWIHLRKKVSCYIKIFIRQLKRFELFKKIILLSQANTQIEDFYLDRMSKFLNTKHKKFVMKMNIWNLKKKYVKTRLVKSYLGKYKRALKIKPNYRPDFLRGNLKWIAVKKWFLRRNRKKWFPIITDKKFVMLKDSFLNLNFDVNLLEYDPFETDEVIIYSVEIDCEYDDFVTNAFNLKIKSINWHSYKSLFFYNKSFFPKRVDIYKKKFFIRNHANLFFFNLLNQYINVFKPFIFELELYKDYIKNILNLVDVNSQFIAKKPKKHDLEEMPLKDKFKRLRILEGGSRSLLYGYKFHFVGRFTRKQKAASLWFAKGANSVSSMRVDVDYGFHTLALRYSACTLKVWLYKNRGYSYKYGYRIV